MRIFLVLALLLSSAAAAVAQSPLRVLVRDERTKTPLPGATVAIPALGTGTATDATGRATLPDLILMDINLPGISGFDAMRILKAGPTTAHIPVVAVSANAMPFDVERGLKAGFYRYITKPIRVSEFMEAVNIALEYANVHPGPGGKP